LTGSLRSDLDAIVLDLDGGPMLEACLTSLSRQTVAPSRVIVWDNGSVVAASARLAGRAGVEIFRSEENLGFAAGMNAALRESAASLVALVNNDVVLDPAWVERLAAVMDATPAVAAVQSVILRPDGLVDGAGIDLSDGTIRQRGHGQDASLLSGSAWGVSATAAIYRRQALDSVSRGGAIFDERLFAWYEDVELCARLLGAGWQTRVLPDALATHRGSSSAGKLGREALRLRVRNRWIVHRMHRSVGRALSLLAEDVRHALRALAGGRFGELATRVGAVARGMTASVRR
jgi:GT2 family glycosyltransferase